MKRPSPHTLSVFFALQCLACDLASRSLGEFVEPRPQRGDLDLDDADGLSHFTVAATDGFAVVALGDLDRDGLDDWAVVADGEQELGDRIYLHYGREDGYPARAQLESIADATFNAGLETRWLTVDPLGDVDADGHADAAIALRDKQGDDALFVLWGSTTRSRGALDVADLPTVVSSTDGDSGGTSLRLHAAGDMNGDGVDDVVAEIDSPSDGSLLLFEGPVARGLPINLDGGRPILGGHVGWHDDVDGGSDVDGDGFDDLVVTDAREAPRTSIVFGAPTGDLDVALAAAGLQLTYPEGWLRVEVGDVTGDDEVDLVIEGSRIPKLVAGPLLPAPEPIAIALDTEGTGFFDLALVGDIDGDGDGEVAVTRATGSLSSDIAGLFLGGPDLASALRVRGHVVGFTSVAVRPPQDDLNGRPRAGRMGDVNGDGFDDWAVLVDSGCSGCGDRLPLHVVYGASYD